MAEVERKLPKPGDILPFEVTQATLANGLRVIVVPTGYPNLVSLQIPVQTGSRNEVEEGKSGFAHFFEHMMFRGTVRYPAEMYKDIVTRTGARQNAYTTDDYTNYHITFAVEDLGQILEIEADRFMQLKYSEDDFRTEARAVLGEYNKNSANPIFKLLEVQREHAYTTHPYKHTTMGFLRDIEAMPEQFEYSRTFFDRWYRPEYTAIIVAGDVQPGPVLALIEKHWGAWERGTHAVAIPQEPAPRAPVRAHVPWTSPTLPWVTVAFHGPAFSESEHDFAAVDVLFDLIIGETSDLYRRLVEVEQKVDEIEPYFPNSADPSLISVLARLKDGADAPYVRDAILETIAGARLEAVTPERLAEAVSHNRYGFARAFDNSESIGETLARFVRFRRSTDTLNNLFHRFDELTPATLQSVARAYLTDERMVLTTLSHEPLPSVMAAVPSLGEFERSQATATASSPAFVVQPSASTLLRMKLLFGIGSAHDPAGKEGLAHLAAEMIVDAGSKERRIDEINRALFPLAASFRARVDREMTAFTGVTHRDNLDRFLSIALPQLLEPGLRDEDFSRIKARQLNELVQDLRANNEEELGKERLQANIFADTPYGHPTLGTVAGIESLSLEDVRAFIQRAYARANLTVGLAGDFPEDFGEHLRARFALLPEADAALSPEVAGRRPRGIEVEIIEKDTRATAISFGHPIAVTRSHPDFAALWLARAWLGEHRASPSHLFQRIREIRGLNYGDYAYIEAFPRGMFQFFPDPNIARRSQIFEVWIRPVMPEHAVFALKIALHEMEKLIESGLSEVQFETVRNYLMKNVFVMTQTQDQQLGYALDSRWYDIGEFTSHMRERMRQLTPAIVRDAIRRHLDAKNVSVVMVAGDAARLRDELLSGGTTAISYDAAKPQDILDEDKVIGARNLAIEPDAVRITPVDDVFAS